MGTPTTEPKFILISISMAHGSHSFLSRQRDPHHFQREIESHVRYGSWCLLTCREMIGKGHGSLLTCKEMIGRGRDFVVIGLIATSGSRELWD